MIGLRLQATHAFCLPVLATCLIESKTAAWSGRSSKMSWAYMSKFGFAAADEPAGGGRGTVSGKVTGLIPLWIPTSKQGATENKEVAEPRLLLYRDDEWLQARDFRNGDNSEYEARNGLDNGPVGNEPRTVETDCFARSELARVNIKLNVSATGVAFFYHNVLQITRPRIWIAVLADCKRTSAAALKKAPVYTESRVFLNWTQANGSHLPCDERWMPGLGLVCTASLIVFLFVFMRAVVKHHDATGEVHPVPAALGIVFFIQLASLVLEQLHLWQLILAGRGNPMARGLSYLCSLFATAAMTALLTLIGHGWTISSYSLRTVAFSGRGGVGPGWALLTVYTTKFVALLGMWLGLLHSAEDGHAIYHDYESCEFVCPLVRGILSQVCVAFAVGGRLVAALQLLLWVVFLTGVQGSVATLTGPLVGFMQKLRLYGSFFILAIPIVVTIAPFASPYMRHRFVNIGIRVVQLSGKSINPETKRSFGSRYLARSCRHYSVCAPVHVPINILQVLYQPKGLGEFAWVGSLVTAMRP